jgi:hypothetical protein
MHQLHNITAQLPGITFRDTKLLYINYKKNDQEASWQFW